LSGNIPEILQPRFIDAGEGVDETHPTRLGASISVGRAETLSLD
jgi:hypothetical protein